ncbi:sigma-70 family RNA polymerase sigma factor [Flexivirga oryzae]|uniref:RNA polymerase sigma factor (Sigma-70 family) n=1 Tax=Flexivirga oryzae TaxID=1794944 RepID=A0A839MY38_9MICO|nr:sigma-70 family RNA polymerase sigma factor [Flexivirga oryzae]MBB2890360.1 RNA polymerase sigma factor (sigma-70 family) [Flexivirga oryzae]
MNALTETDDRELLALVRDGDPQAMAELWSRHYPATLAAARRISRQPKDAEEFASDAFSGMLQALSNNSGPSASVRGYLLTAVRNQATNRARRSSAGDVLTDEVTDFEDSERAPLDPVAHHAELGLVREAFATLPPRWQMVLWRTAVDQEKNTVVAAELGRSPNAVAALARRARLGFRVAYIRAHASTHGVAPECAPYVPRLVELLPNAETVAAQDVRDHVDDCPKCERRLADLLVVDRDLGGILLPAVLALGPGIAWATAAGHATHVAGGAFWLKWVRGAGQGRKLATIGTAAAVTVAGTCSAYALTRNGPGATHAAVTHSATSSVQRSVPSAASSAAGTQSASGGATAHRSSAAHRSSSSSATRSLPTSTSGLSSSPFVLAPGSASARSTTSHSRRATSTAAPTSTTTARPTSTAPASPRPSSTHPPTSTHSPTSTHTATPTSTATGKPTSTSSPPTSPTSHPTTPTTSPTTTPTSSPTPPPTCLPIPLPICIIPPWP